MNKKTFKTICSEWRKSKAGTVKESSFATYLTCVDRHILPFFGDKISISEGAVKDFIDMKMAEGLKHNTLKELLMVLRMIAKFGMRHGWTEYYGWEIRLPKREKWHVPDVLTVSEQRRMMGFLRENISFRNIGIYICLCTGMRIGEICALQWGDISFETKTIKVRRTIERVYFKSEKPMRTQIIISTPKTENSLRDIPLNAELAKMLRPFASISTSERYMLTNSLKPLEPRLYRLHYKNVLKKIGLPDVKFHGLRHTFATRCIESQCDYKTVSSILGHANISTTMNLYVHPDIEQKRRCIDRMLRKVQSKL